MAGRGRQLIGIVGLGAALSLALSPALGRAGLALSGAEAVVSLSALGSIGSFTPVTSDQRLARAYASAAAGARSHGFRFTPTVGALSGRSITIVVRAPSDERLRGGRSGNAANALGLGPVAYNLGSARGLNRFMTEVAGSVPEAAEPLVPASALVLPKSFSLEKPKRLSTSVALEPGKGGAGSLPLVTDNGYAVDLASSYALTRNLAVTAGVRYKGSQYRLGPITDDAQDSQAVYVGTSFKF